MSDLSLGTPFGMLLAAKDSAPAPRSNKQAMESYGQLSSATLIDQKEIPAVAILNGRGRYAMAMGPLPAWWRPLLAKTPWFRQLKKDSESFAGIAIMAVVKRLATPTYRNDLLGHLLAAKDGHVRSFIGPLLNGTQ